MRSRPARSDRRGAGRDNVDGQEFLSSGGLPPVVRKLRCAVYTRKSTEEGLDMEFNTLDAQREACEAYVVSQRAEGWLPVEDRYDDGGVSGGTLERPALKRLLADVEAGKIDVILVYKIDRLSRSMLDFLKLVETFERHGVTFVSITQSFNTTNSMGRLTLNVLLSFAQFEREVIGERIRDKVAASRKKGMWMGGWTPLGYEVSDRKLVIHKADAERVRSIFKRFVQLKSATLLARELVLARATNRYGQLLDKGVLYRILNNRGAPSHHRPQTLGPGACHSQTESSPTGGQRPGADACAAEGVAVRTRWRRDVADPHPQGGTALSLLHQPNCHEAGHTGLPRQTNPGCRDRTHRHRTDPVTAADTRSHHPDLASCPQDRQGSR